jgi:DNA-3-methyladenine glycosylase II
VAADPWFPAVEHLRTTDERWHPLIERVGACTLRPRRDRFGTLVRAIIGQQISAKAASTIDARLRAFTGERHEPASLIAVGEAGLRACGLSGVKARYVLNLAEAVQEGRLPLARIGALDDETVKNRLTSIKGIGPWTAEMFLIFSLNRPDVLSVGDLGIRVGLRDFHGLDSLPSPRECVELTENWRPYRSIAMWYLWRVIDARPAATPVNGPIQQLKQGLTEQAEP